MKKKLRNEVRPGGRWAKKQREASSAAGDQRRPQREPTHHQATSRPRYQQASNPDGPAPNVPINTHQATPGYPPGAELLIRQPCTMDVQKQLLGCQEEVQHRESTKFQRGGNVGPRRVTAPGERAGSREHALYMGSTGHEPLPSYQKVTRVQLPPFSERQRRHTHRYTHRAKLTRSQMV